MKRSATSARDSLAITRWPIRTAPSGPRRRPRARYPPIFGVRSRKAEASTHRTPCRRHRSTVDLSSAGSLGLWIRLHANGAPPTWRPMSASAASTAAGALEAAP
jgi:hypothetical protein